MAERQYQELTGTILSCSVGHNAVIRVEDRELVTTPVTKISMVWQGKFYFQTEDCNFVVKGAILTEDKNDDELQDVYDKIMTILINSGVTLDLTAAIPTLKKDSQSKSFKECQDWFRPRKELSK